MFKCRIKILIKFVEKLFKCMILFNDILTFLVLDNRDGPLITLHFFVIGISKNQMNQIILTYQILLSTKVKNQRVLNERSDFLGTF